MAQVQRQFDFKDWQQAFQFYRANQPLYDNLVMIISTHWTSSGYWVESKPDKLQLPDTDKMYVGDEVDALESRIRAAISKGERMNRLIY